MEVHHRIEALESRARAVGSTISDLCATTGVARATVSRWRNGHGSPMLRNYLDVFAKLEQAIVDREIALRDHLVALHGLPCGKPGGMDPGVRRGDGEQEAGRPVGPTGTQEVPGVRRGDGDPQAASQAAE